MDLDVIFGEEKVEIVLGGQTYEASRLRLGDFAKFRSWAKQQKLAAFLAAVATANVDAALFSSTVEKLLDAGAHVKRDEKGEPVKDESGLVILDSDPVINAMGTEEGMRELLTLSIRRKHPRFDAELLSDLEIEQLSKVADVIARISVPSGTPVGGLDPNLPQAEKEG